MKDHRDLLHKIKIIDFGLAQKYVDEKGQHIPAAKERFFQGNLIFASRHCFNLVTHSRRDDLISLSYLLLYLIDGDLAFLTKDGESQAENADEKQFNQAEFQRIKGLKNKMTAKMLCESPEALTLLPFLEEVFAYEFEQAPDYAKLKTMLVQCLANEGKTVDHIFDWNEEYERERQILGHKPQDPKMVDVDVQEQSPTHALAKMGGYQLIANENQAAMKKVSNQEDAHMNHSFDEELVGFNP